MKIVVGLIFFLLIASCGSNKVLITGSRDYDKHEENIYPLSNDDEAIIYFIDNKDSDSTTFADKYIFSQYGEVAVYAPHKYSIYHAKPGKLTLFIDGLEHKRNKVKKNDDKDDEDDEDDTDEAKKEDNEKDFITIDVEPKHVYFIQLKLDQGLITGRRILTLNVIKESNVLTILKYIKNNLSYITLPRKLINNTSENEKKFLEESKGLTPEEKELIRIKYLGGSHRRMIQESVNREVKGQMLNNALHFL
jgi:hypothetical protein